MANNYTIGKADKAEYSIYTTRFGFKAVDTNTVISNRFNYSVKNSKLGENVLNFGMDIMHTCTGCECKTKGKCYGTCGFFQMGSNMLRAAENYVFWKVNGSEGMKDALQYAIDNNPMCEMFRYFEIGDIPSLEFLSDVMVPIASMYPDIDFWTYTKKYDIVNKYVDMFGLDAIPENLVIIFSHWMNEDGSYFPMDNRYDFPTSEFIPIGKEEELLPHITHVCPCSDPTVIANCSTCEHPCRKLRHGESMALLEHSTKETAKRDKELKAAHKALKASR